MKASIKNPRRISIGPNATILCQNYDLVWFQIQEMLFVEKGGEKQMQEEMAAYNVLIPKPNELIFTLFFEYELIAIRKKELARLGHAEDAVYLSLGDLHKIRAVTTDSDIERTSPQGKTSAVHFLKFQFTSQQVEAFHKCPKVTMSIEHENYNHSTTFSASTSEMFRNELKSL